MGSGMASLIVLRVFFGVIFGVGGEGGGDHTQLYLTPKIRRL